MSKPLPRRLLSSTATLLLATLLSTLLACGAHAQEAAIRKTLAERYPDFPKVDEITKSPIEGLYEVRSGNHVFYSDAKGEYVVEGAIIDTKTRVSLTQLRIDKLQAFDFATLPLKDAIVWKQGNGKRKMVVFADPNCGYCKKFESDMQAVKNVTVYTFLIPILGGDSPAKSRDIWCAKNNGAVWRDWMIIGTAPVRSMGNCDISALQRNVALAKKHGVESTPSLVFEDNKRTLGALPIDQIEKQLVASRRKS